MTAIANPPLDRVNDAVLHARADLASLTDTPLWTLGSQAATAAIDQLLALEAQVVQLKTAALAHADQLNVADQAGATSTANWLAHHTKLTRREAHDWPPGLAHMHHPIPWSQGGPTNRDGLLICPPHHTRAHDPAFTMTKLPTGNYTFTRRT